MSPARHRTIEDRTPGAARQPRGSCRAGSDPSGSCPSGPRPFRGGPSEPVQDRLAEAVGRAASVADTYDVLCRGAV